MIYILRVLMLFIPMMFFSGCISKALNIGEEKTYCEEHGRDFSDAGTCKRAYSQMEERMGGSN